MFTNTQILPLLALVADIASHADDTGCQGNLTVTSKSAVQQAGELALALRRSPLQLALGVHSHRQGDAVYAFALPQGQPFSEGDFKQFLGEQFEEVREEFADVSLVPDNEIVQLAGDEPSAEPVDYQPIEEFIDAAKQHGVDSEPDHEVGDLQDLLRAMWELLTPEQRLAYVGLHKVQEVKATALGEI
ncbi:hypothetical protein [Rubrivivax gelatinosus]|uniref:hypothetical protein n=1 Tax=Rubrivivax gelatinosus TaxID=28068 RepID=UPI0002D6ABEF|nr:hypothetical protein [Rubrivivax gelatinosus]MBG6083059.1 hypothetical protein [Rubrivivax gelatinosus]